MTRAAFPGWFQPFHEGHFRTVKWCRDEYNEFVLVIGSSGKSCEPTNPLTGAERAEIIRGCFPELSIVELSDENRGEVGCEDWTKRLVEKSGADVIISGNDLVRRLVTEYTDAKLVTQKLHNPERYSGTEIRTRIRDGQPWRSLVPDCCRDIVESYADVIKASG